MRDELRQVLRGLGRAKLTTSVLLLSLALGTGANATLFSVMDALLFRPPSGIADASRLAWVFTSQFTGASYGLTSIPDFTSQQQAVPAFASLGAFDDSTVTVARVGDIGQRVRVAAVTSGFFTTLGMQAQQGRLLGDEDAAAERPPAVISDSLWRNAGAPADVVGRDVVVGDVRHAIVGVAPVGFNGLQLGRPADVWVPLPAGGGASRGDRRLAVIGRLHDGRSLADVNQELDSLGTRLAVSYPETNLGTRTNPEEARRMTAAGYSRLDLAARSQVLLISTVVLGSTGLLLFSACVNAGSLLLSRSAARRRELAVKLALGASRGVLIRQVLIESLVVSLGGAAFGLVVAHWTASVLPAFLAPEEASMLDTSLDAVTVGTTIVLSCVAGALFAIGPARHALQTVDIQVLRGDPGTIADRAGGRFRTAVVVGQVALSTVLLIASGVMVRALTVALEGDLGPGGRGVAIALVRMPGALEGDIVRGIRFTSAAADAAGRIPGAEAAGWVSVLPVGRSNSQLFHYDAGRPGVTERLEIEVNVASSGYFNALRIPIVEGRPFTAADTALSTPVVIVNDMLARRYFGSTAVGHKLLDSHGIAYEIVGVVKSGRYRTLQEAPESMVYFPLAQRDQEYMHLVVRTAQSAAPAVAALPALLRGVDPGLELKRATTFDGHLAEALTLDRILTTVVALCGVAALALATMGVYGVVGDAVRRRTPEIGLRVALGAPSSRILGLVFREGLPLTALGSAAGIGGAVILSRVLRMFVHAVPSVDLPSLAIVPVGLLLVVVGAAVVPLRRALRVSPTIALRADG